MFNLKSQRKIQLAVDIGNRLLKSCTTNGAIKTLPSWYKDLEQWDTPLTDKNSVIIQYLKGDNANLIKQSWVVGHIAQDLGGNPTFESEKAFLAPKLVLSMLDAGGGPQHVVVERLVCALPNELQEDKVTAIVKGLIGTHQIKRNGEELKIEIQNVEVQPETLGAFKWVLAHKYFKYARINGILDLGGKTGIGQLYTKNGTLIRESRIIVGGTYQLAQLVTQHPQLIRLDTTPQLSIIMDAIADNSLTYGTMDINFADQFPTYVAQWLNDIRNKLKLSWAKWLPVLGEFVIVGGSAALAKPIVEQTAGRFKVAKENPQFCNVLGMLQ
jgi:hypothetical protein